MFASFLAIHHQIPFMIIYGRPRDGPRVDVPGDMGWWDFGDGAQDSEDLNWCEDEEKLVGGNSAREDEREVRPGGARKTTIARMNATFS